MTIPAGRWPTPWPRILPSPTRSTIIGVHYSCEGGDGGNANSCQSTKTALDTAKPLWDSESGSQDDNSGAGSSNSSNHPWLHRRQNDNLFELATGCGDYPKLALSNCRPLSRRAALVGSLQHWEKSLGNRRK